MKMEKNNLPEELSRLYLEKVGAAVAAVAGRPGEWAAARARESAAREVMKQVGAVFAPVDSIGGIGHFTKHIPSGEKIALRCGFLLHTRECVLDGTGIAVEDVIDDGKPKIVSDCVGVLDDGRAVRFYAFLSLAQAIGVTPPDDAAMAEAVISEGKKGSLEWWVE